MFDRTKAIAQVQQGACACEGCKGTLTEAALDRKSTRLNSSHLVISYAVFCLKKKKKNSLSVSVRLHSAQLLGEGMGSAITLERLSMMIVWYVALIFHWMRITAHSAICVLVSG